MAEDTAADGRNDDADGGDGADGADRAAGATTQSKRDGRSTDGEDDTPERTPTAAEDLESANEAPAPESAAENTSTTAATESAGEDHTNTAGTGSASEEDDADRAPTDEQAVATDAEQSTTPADGEDDGPSEVGHAADGATEPDAPGTAESGEPEEPAAEDDAVDVPTDVQQYARFKKVDGSRYERVNDFLRDRTYITAREWAIARLCADFRTETGVEMTKIGENLPELVPFMTDTYSPQAVNQARASFEEKVRMAGATFLYGAMCDFFTAEELDDLIYEVTEVAKFLLEVEGVDLAVEDELETEDRISDVMREVRTASEALRNGPVECPECGHEISNEEHAAEETEE